MNALRALADLPGLEHLSLGHASTLARVQPPLDFSPLSRLTRLKSAHFALHVCGASSGSMPPTWPTAHALLRALPAESLEHLTLLFLPGVDGSTVHIGAAVAAAVQQDAAAGAAPAAAAGAAVGPHAQAHAGALAPPAPAGGFTIASRCTLPVAHLSGSGTVLPAVRSLRLPRSSLSHGGVAALASLCPNLESLTLLSIDAEALPGAAALEHVTQLSVVAGVHGALAADMLLAAMPSLKTMHLPQV